jgi:hypothetical protein
MAVERLAQISSRGYFVRRDTNIAAPLR